MDVRQAVDGGGDAAHNGRDNVVMNCLAGNQASNNGPPRRSCHKQDSRGGLGYGPVITVITSGYGAQAGVGSQLTSSVQDVELSQASEPPLLATYSWPL